MRTKSHRRAAGLWCVAILLVYATAFAQAAPPVNETPEQEPNVTLVYMQGKMEQIVNAVEKQTGRQIDVLGKAKGMRADIIAKDRPFTEILDRITEPGNLVWWQYDAKKYSLADFDTYADLTLRKPTLYAGLEHLEKEYHCARADGADGTIRLTFPARPKPVRGGPASLIATLGVDMSATSEAADPIATAVYKNAYIEQVVTALRMQTRKSIRVRGSLAGSRVSVQAKEVPLGRTLDKLCVGAGDDVVWWETPNGEFGIAHTDFFRDKVVGNGFFEKCLDALAKAHGMSWTKTSSPGGIDYTLQKAAAKTKAAAPKSAPGAAAPAKDSAPAQPKAAVAAPKVAGNAGK